MAKRRPIEVSEYPVERAERLAKIMGDSSATAKALIELKRRQSEGENVVLLVAGGTILVGPPLPQS